MSPYDQNQDEIESLINKIVSITKVDQTIIDGKLLKTIITKFDNPKKYFHSVFIIEKNFGVEINLSWSEIETICLSS
jgi:hypothetical protein